MFPSNIVSCNNLAYCESHGREVCHECTFDDSFSREFSGFELPENGQPEYPVFIDHTNLESALVAKRWLDIEREANPGPPQPLKKSQIRLPKVKVSDEVKNSTTAMQETLLGVFRQLLPMCATQRYFFANQPRILIEDFETFEQASLLYEDHLVDTMKRGFDLFMLRGIPMTPALMSAERKKKARASLVSMFGLLLELNTQRTFWRMMELTTEAYICLLEKYDNEADGQVVLTEKAQADLLEWIGHVFWSLRHAQYVLNEFRKRQHEVYQRNQFPFYPLDMDAVKAGLDVHLIIAKLSRGPIHDFHFMASAFSELKQASEFREQMVHVNYATMVSIDEMSARFRVLELLTRAGQLVATRIEVKKALTRFSFDPKGAELNSAMDDAQAVITEVASVDERNPTPNICSYLQLLLVQENECRSKHKEKFVRLPVPDSREVTKEMFDNFKPTYTKLYRDSIRLLWKAHERSLLSSEVAHRIEHRREVQKRNNKKKKASLSKGSGWEQGDLAEAREVPEQSSVDSSLFWETGDGSMERYVLPAIRQKIKTRKSAATDAEASSSSVTSSAPSIAEGTPRVPRPLDQLKESDLTTRDILWRKVKGAVKWTSLVQFLTRLGCSIFNLDGSKKKVVDPHSGGFAVLHRPHPHETCRRDQLDIYRMQLEDWLHVSYADLVTPDEKSPRSRCSDRDSACPKEA